MSRDPTWGVVATIKAPDTDILNFAAWHLEQGAHRVQIYLDEDAPNARTALKAHPKCRVILTDAQYWKRRRRHKGRPEKHQTRQSLNATHCYKRNPQVDWLLHTDVDEFLWPVASLTDQLAALPDAAISARVRPIEVMAPDPNDPPDPDTFWCKACARLLAHRRTESEAIYPTYGSHLNGGFISHVAGKVFVRTGQEDVSLRIHNAFHAGEMDREPVELSQTKLVHMHAPDWDHWYRHYRYRLQHGSYRADLRPAPQPDGVSLKKHALFATLEAEGGEEALHRLFQEICTATPELRERLKAHGLLHKVTLDLNACRARHFPDFG
ncbi:glycosyltransferase family 2 protein [Roseovarius rhodophyticola]|uniref:Glycosyltransferase family 2 protein n=1 Tax=Roseovarius rhodophyticola TaxID=3080827 RepID=A0ABZ2TH09_9RHOB|nr:glycosyltransferase family 2 protein [Roseovarius sp. W115]MDV2931471.1 glycosyltransferase family 2 protein [Roseovarius sp. W115]